MTDPHDASGGQDTSEPALTWDEQSFRARLLLAADRLDVPSNMLDVRLRARLADACANDRGFWHWQRWRQAAVGISLALAASVALIVALGRGRETYRLMPEPLGAQTNAEPRAATASSKTRLVVWDGDTQGLQANGWAGPDKSDKSLSTLKKLGGIGHDGSNGLSWHAEGINWTGFGWNWFAWIPTDAGTDITDYDALVFKMRLEAGKATDLPETWALMISLNSSTGSGKRSTESVKLSNYVGPELLDGKWHEIIIPLRTLYSGKSASGFEPRKTWEFDMGHWSTERRNFTAYIDDIGFEKGVLHDAAPNGNAQ
jgi:hypothetical protein